MIKVNNLSKHFTLDSERTLYAVNEVSFEIQPGEILGLVGESGCGKSTLGRTLAGLYDKTNGTVELHGEKLPESYTAKDFQRMSRLVQMIFQDPYASLNPRMTVKEIIAEGPLLGKLWKKSEVNTKVAEWLKLVGLSAEHMSRYPHEFSGGQRQRIGIARALALEPKLVICDEPISALDVSIQAQVINLLKELKEKFGLTLLFIAHDLSMVRYISDRMAVMYLGKIVEIGAADDVFFNPQHPYTKLLVGSNPEPDPKSERTRVAEKILGEIPTPVNVKPGCLFASRCPMVTDRCRSETPALRPVDKDNEISGGGAHARLAACHLLD